jgi:hypothetical protein
MIHILSRIRYILHCKQVYISIKVFVPIYFNQKLKLKINISDVAKRTLELSSYLA